ncbi:uncharacterized protein LODBEIA_P51350 [Lodderomyces beijingensis]|uniref:MPN domain-containing protein n=1 Tax=Lodderomyces beijingensis TaxID=1775926 RepID=A0ABP0ZUW2_9ASCO
MGCYDELAKAIAEERDSSLKFKSVGTVASGDDNARDPSAKTSSSEGSSGSSGGSRSNSGNTCTSDCKQGQQVYQLPSIDPVLAQRKPWKTDAKYFNQCKISSLALVKMCVHAQTGGSIEIMGMLVGKIVDRTIVVMDTYRLPVEGTETRVNAQSEAYEYMVQYLDLNKKAGGESNEKGGKRDENIVGWYHSHPGYGCWLSGIDYSTQALNQGFQDPYLAIVVDPVKTLKSGKVDIGAFRTLPDGYMENQSSAAPPAQLQNLPKSKRSEFGSHSSRYYSLDIEIFESPRDREMLKLLKSEGDFLELIKTLEVDLNQEVRAAKVDEFNTVNYFHNYRVIEEDNLESQDDLIIDVINTLQRRPKDRHKDRFANSVLLKRTGHDFEDVMYRKLLVQGAAGSREQKKKQANIRRREAELADDEVMDESDLDKGDRDGTTASVGTSDQEADSADEVETREGSVRDEREVEEEDRGQQDATDNDDDDGDDEDADADADEENDDVYGDDDGDDEIMKDQEDNPWRHRRSIPRASRRFDMSPSQARNWNSRQLTRESKLARRVPLDQAFYERRLRQHSRSRSSGTPVSNYAVSPMAGPVFAGDDPRSRRFMRHQSKHESEALGRMGDIIGARHGGGSGRELGVVGGNGMSALEATSFLYSYAQSASSMEPRDKNKKILDTVFSLAAQNICDLISLDAREKLLASAKSN